MPTPPSTFFATNKGARAMYMVLQRLLPKTEQWRLPMTELQNHADMKGSTLVVMGPPMPLSEREADALDMWIRNGGQLILATSRSWDIEHPRGDRVKRVPRRLPRTASDLSQTWRGGQCRHGV